MTACVNNEKKMKGGALPGKVARTFLAGALAAAMVPSVAFASVEPVGSEAELMSEAPYAQADGILIDFGNGVTYKAAINGGSNGFDAGVWTGTAGEEAAPAWTQVANAKSTARFYLTDGDTTKEIKTAGDSGTATIAWSAETGLSKPGTVTFTLDDNDDDSLADGMDNATISFATGKGSLSGATVVFSKNTVDYTGSAVSPSVSKVVLADGYEITGTTGLTPAGNSQTEVGTYQMTLTDNGSNKYDGSASAYWTISSNSVATEQELWELNSFEYNVEGKSGSVFAAAEDSSMALESVKDPDGNVVSPSEYTVLYFDIDADQTSPAFDAGDLVVSGTKTVDGENGGMPTDAYAGTYAIAVIKGDLSTTDQDKVKSGEFSFSDLTNASNGYCYVSERFTISAAKASIEGAYACEVTKDSNGKVLSTSDVDFTYDGAALDLELVVDGKVLNASDYDIAFKKAPADNAATTLAGITLAGDYELLVTAKGTSSYTGTTTVKFTVKALDLSTAEISIAPVTTNFGLSSGVLASTNLVVNGEKLPTATEVSATLVSVNGKAAATGNPTEKGEYVFLVKPASTAAEGCVTGSAEVKAYNVQYAVGYAYNGKALSDQASGNFAPDDDGVYGSASAPFATFNAEKGSTFVPGAFDAYSNDVLQKDAEIDVKVTKDGKEVSSYDEPGVYTVQLTTPVSDDYAYAGSLTCYFEVPGADYSKATIYATMGGKVLSATSNVREYTGSAFVPSVVVKDGKETLVAGEDYTVAYENAKGEEVDEIKAVGKYSIVVEMNDVAKSKTVIPFEVEKATIEAAAPSAEFFALPLDGSAATPSFVGYTDADLTKAQKFELASDEVSVKYYKAVWNEPVTDASGNVTTPGFYSKGDAVKASELTEAGHYFADVTVLTTAENVDGSVSGVLFEVSETAKFTDVDANEWYATPVYKAAELGYVNGIQGTTLFAPTSPIDRSQIVSILFNMAGGKKDAVATSYPTRFSDVDKDAWYAKAVSWASTAGVVSGYAGTDRFGTFDKATREEVAAMFYNYAKSMGDDMSVEDVDGALAKYADGDQVSPWMREAVAWCVENGVMGNGSSLSPLAQISRAEVAAMAVNYQPEALK